MGRSEIRWASFLFELGGTEGRPLDRIEGVLNRDKKTATYKLALFRALSDIAGHHHPQAKWQPDGHVAIPIRLIAEKWFRYYWPIFESEDFIPQINGERRGCTNGLKFRGEHQLVIDEYRDRGRLSQFLVDEAGGGLAPTVTRQYTEALRAIESAIREGPVGHCSGNLFGYKKRHVLVAPGAWSEFCQLGHWIESAVVLRWAEETNRMSKGEIPVAEILRLLLVSPTEERNIGEAKQVFDQMNGKRCV